MLKTCKNQMPLLVPGEWSVRVFIDGTEIDGKSFHIEGTLYTLNGGKVSLK